MSNQGNTLLRNYFIFQSLLAYNLLSYSQSISVNLLFTNILVLYFNIIHPWQLHLNYYIQILNLDLAWKCELHNLTLSQFVQVRPEIDFLHHRLESYFIPLFCATLLLLFSCSSCYMSNFLISLQFAIALPISCKRQCEIKSCAFIIFIILSPYSATMSFNYIFTYIQS